MKLRQKLAAVLAATMIITAVPVTTMAASNNSLSHTITMVEGSKVGYSVSEKTFADDAEKKADAYEVKGTSPEVVMNLDASFKFDEEGHTFYINAVDGKFDKKAFQAYGYVKANTGITGVTFDSSNNVNGTTTGSAITAITPVAQNPEFQVAGDNGSVVTVTWLSDTQIQVNVAAAAGTGTVTIAKDNGIRVPVLMEAKKGTPTLEINAKNSPFTGGKLVLSEQVSDKKLSVKIDEAQTISVDGGEITKLTVEEVTLGALKNATAKERQIKIKLPNSSDLEFDNTNTVKVKGTYGFSDLKETAANVISNDGKELVIELPAQAAKGNTTGAIEITGITVSPEGREDAKKGAVTATISGEAITEVKGTVAEVKDFGAELKVEEKVELIGGKEAKEVKVKLKELALGSLNERHDAYFTVDNAEIMPGTIKATLGEKKSVLKVVEDVKEGKVVGFEVEFAGIDETKRNEIEVEFEVAAKATASGDVKVTAESRSFAQDLTAVVATVKEAIKVDATGMTVKVGLQGQVGGKIVITETDKEMLERNKEIIIDVVDAKENGIKLADAKVEAENLQLDKVKIENGQIKLTVKRSSDEAGKITISDLKVDVNRMTPEGKFDLQIGGEAISRINTLIPHGEKEVDKMADVVEMKDFIVVGTPNTEDGSASNGLKKGTAAFTIGSNKYTVNGEEKTMDAAPYASSKNRTMMPVRYVSEAFGIAGNDVVFSNVNGGTVTLFAGNRVIQVKNNSDMALVNGVQIKMDEKVTIKEGRTYVPVGEMGRLLGVQVEWDNTAKTATFTNK